MSDTKSTTIPENRHPKTMRLARDLASDYLRMLELRQNGSKHFQPSGFNALDKMLPGWLHEGHLIIVAGRPGMGKSAFGQQIAEAVAAQNRTAVMFTLEMSSYEITERAISRRSGVPIPKLKTAEGITDDDWRCTTDAFSQFSQLPFLVDDASFEITSLMKKAHAVFTNLSESGLPPLGCIVVDYLQLVGGSGANRNLEVGQVTRNLKQLAKELNVPIIALSQLNRAVESRNDKRPTISDLRESGSIEQDADLVLFLYRDEYYNERSQEKGVAEVIAAKNRHGSTGTVKLGFVGDRIMFRDDPGGQWFQEISLEMDGWVDTPLKPRTIAENLKRISMVAGDDNERW